MEAEECVGDRDALLGTVVKKKKAVKPKWF
jgi:hypothetical protein